MVATVLAKRVSPHNPCIPVWLCPKCGRWVARALVDGRHLHLIPKLRPGKGGELFEHLPVGLGAAMREAFLEESLEATTMHEPLPYPADRLEWLGSLQPGSDAD